MYRFRIILCCFLVALTCAARAQDLPPLTGPVVLTVTGLDVAAFPGGKLELDVPMLQAIGATRFTTSTIWTEGSHVYTGVLLKNLQDRIKSGDHALKFIALNDYSVEIPAQDISDDAPMLAYAMDDAPMSVREKGPLWVLYPFDADAKYRTDTTFSRSIWQLDRIEVLK
ncbi:MAG: oxidoreductase [Paracoccaceae bacterium]